MTLSRLAQKSLFLAPFLSTTKNVRIISVQRTDAASNDGGPQMKLEFAKSMFEKSYLQLAQKSQNLAGIVLIFDSSDGGMIVAPQSTLEKWEAGAFSDADCCQHCFFDPPATFTASGPSSIR